MSKAAFRILCCLALLHHICPLSSSAIQLEPVLSGFTSPLYVTNAHDGTNRLFVVEQAGRIKVLQSGSTTASVFLDITLKVLSGGERGLLGLAFHPQYSINRRFFANYTRQTDGATVIAEYRASTADPNIADTAETVLLTIPQPFPNHNGGMIEFGPDGYLHIATGDGGSANDPGNRAQDIEDLLGKILRIDIDHPNGAVPYSSPADNPFFGPTPGRDEIYAFGFRNPWRYSFDDGTGQLYVADVGQGAREEIDIVTLGGNYGWRVFEGSLCTNLDPGLCSSDGSIAPIAEYSHSGGRCSIAGGYVYRGARSSLPVGTYIYGDFCTGEIFLLNNGSQSVILDTTLNISSFGEDEAKEILVVGLGGTVHRMSSSPVPPPCSYTISQTSQSSPGTGGEGSVAVTTAGDCNWLAASHASWITIVSPRSGTGNGTVAYSVAPNSDASPRTGAIFIAGQALTVMQNGAACTYSISPTSVDLTASGGSGSVTVTAPVGCRWRAVRNTTWITITSGGTGSGSGIVTYSVAAKISDRARIGRMIIARQLFTVRQSR